MSEPVPVTLTVNGRKRSAMVEARLLLVHHLRENLNLTGHARGLRHEPVRRLHGVARRAQREVLHGLRRAGPTARRYRRSRVLPTAMSFIPCRKDSGRSTACSAATARRG